MSETFEFAEINSTDGAKIKVFGIGGGGQNAVDHMINERLDGVEFSCANTDAQALRESKAPILMKLGEQSTKGLGAGADPNVGKTAAEENRELIREALQGADMVFLTAGMGGGTGTGATPIFAEIAKELGVLTIAVVTKPFGFEGRKRMQIAEAGIRELSKHVDSLIVIPNAKLQAVLGKSITLLNAFKAANNVLLGAVKGIAELITRAGLINVDYADVKTVMSEKGMAMMGTGISSGENRAREAAEAAISSPLLEDINLSGAGGVLVNITAGMDMSIGEFEAVGEVIKSFASEYATVVVGTVIDMDMTDELRVTVVVTGLGVEESKDSVDYLPHKAKASMNVQKKEPVQEVPPPVKNGDIQLEVPPLLQASPIPRETRSSLQEEKLIPVTTAEDDMDYIDRIPAFLRKKDGQ